MTSLSVFWHDAVLGHDTGQGVWEQPASSLMEHQELHPENGLRIENMKSILERGPLAADIRWMPGRFATAEELQSVHETSYVEKVAALCRAGSARLADESTVVGAGTWEAATAAAGTALEAVDAVVSGQPRALALVRPPGHHAKPAEAGGYCVFNNAALMAQRARDSGIPRVAIVDWDVHHGNGTQACFYDRADVLTISMHVRTGLWGPTHYETGSPHEVGSSDGQGFNVNVELPVGSGDRAYVEAMRAIVQPILRQFEPGLIIGAQGQDTSAFDANGRGNVSMAGFHALGRMLRASADECCTGLLAMSQEGGYARTYSAFCLDATLEGVLQRELALEEELAYIPDDFRRAREAVEDVQSALSRYWNFTADERNGAAQG